MTDKNKLKISSRIRLARNIDVYNFPHKLDEPSARELVQRVEEAFFVSKPLAEEYRSRHLWEEKGLDLMYWFEKHLDRKSVV